MTEEAPPGRRVPVASSVLRDVGYDAERKTLTVGFTTGRVYEYLEVEVSVHDALVNAPSAGAFFNQHIRDQYRFYEITEISG